MTREQKYKDTKTFHFFNANPKKRTTTDCVIRAISTALEMDYNTVVRELAEMQVKTGYDDGDVKCYGRYLESKGWHKHKQPRYQDNTKYTGSDFCNMLNSTKQKDFGNVVCKIGGHHVVAIVPIGADGYKVCDIWNSTRNCVGNYWTKGEEI